MSQFLVACGGGSVSGYGSSQKGGGSLGPFTFVSPDPVTSPIPDNTPTPTPSPAADLDFRTEIKIDNTTGSLQTNIPFTFGHVFAVGDVPSGNSVAGKLSNNSLIPLQVNIKAGHTLGNSLRHAVISGVLPSLAANATEIIRLYTSTPLSVTPITAATFLSTNPGFTSRVYIRVGNEVYSASARTLLAGSNIQWLSGPTANEWIVAGPLLKTSDNVTPHPHLTVRFAIRSFTGSNKTKVDVTLENNKTFTAGAQNFTYDSKIFVGGVEVDSIAGLTHYHHARWHKSFWWGSTPQIHIKHNIPYLIATKAVPNYDQTVTPSPSAIAQMVTDMAGNVGPMNRTLLGYYMPTGGGRIDIGPLPGWYVLYLLSMDKSAKESMLNIADSSGSWRMHYRDETDPPNTSTHDLPVRIDKAGNDALGVAYNTINVHGNFNHLGPLPVPRCGEWDTTPECEVPYHPDTAHQPSLAYLPYLVTGDYFYLEELQFWATWNFLEVHSAIRGYAQGLLHWQQVRAQAWSMRTLGQAAYITPDLHPLKSYFVDRVANNLTYYDNLYRVGNHNQLGVVLSSDDALSTGLRPWQDDFFTWSMGYLTELGFTQAQPFFDWKKAFVIGRMDTATSNFCWITASAYVLTIRPAATDPMYTTFANVYTNTFGTYNGVDGTTLASKACASQLMANWITANSTNTGIFDNWGSGTFSPKQMLGYANEPTGFPANMQPALAVSVVSASNEWLTFMSRDWKPSYTAEPQFAIVPRN